MAAAPPRGYLVDLFCGCGGFSAGAVAAGFRPIIAVDCWEEALRVHEANHPDCEHLLEELGAVPAAEYAEKLRALIRLPEGSHLHVHGSPPCQQLTVMNRVNRDEKEGMRLVSWFLDFVEAFGPDTYTLEQVPHKLVVAALTPGHEHRILRCEEYGISQMRRRIVAGTVDWEELEALRCPPVPMRDVFAAIGFEPEGCDAMCTGNRPPAERRPGGERSHRGFDRVGFTVWSTSPHMYDTASRRSKTVPLAVLKALQTLPPTYDFAGHRVKDYRKMIGNCVPSELARKVMTCVRSPAGGATSRAPGLSGEGR